MDLFAEGGLVENATAALLALLAVILALRAARAPRFWHLPVIAALLCMRELDLDKAAPYGILKSRTYTGDAPLAFKLFGLAVIALILLCLWCLVRHGWRPFREAWRAGRAWPGLTVAAVAMVVVAKSIDGLNRKLAPFGLSVGEDAAAFSVAAEETMELGFAALLVIAAVTAAMGTKRAAGRG